MRAILPAHGKVDHRCNGPDPIPVLVHLKIFSDTAAAAAGDDARRFVTTDDLGGTFLRSVHATVTTVGGSTTGIQIHNLTNADDAIRHDQPDRHRRHQQLRLGHPACGG